MKKQVFILLTILLSSCKVSPEPINYGSETCHYCSMTVIDQQHASQLVTKKGKVFKFDSIECMMYHLKNVEAADLELYRVNDYDQPGELIDATRAIYLISEGIPSPMGENLSAFRNGENAEKAQEEQGGNLFNWQELQNHFKNKQV